MPCSGKSFACQYFRKSSGPSKSNFFSSEKTTFRHWFDIDEHIPVVSLCTWTMNSFLMLNFFVVQMPSNCSSIARSVP